MDLLSMVKSIDDPSVDPDKKAELIKKVQENMTVMTDEFGEQLKIIHIGDMNMPAEMLTSKGKRKFRDTRETPLRDDDVILISYPKTGTHWTCNLLHFLMQTGPLDSAVSKAPVLLELYTLDEVEATPSPRILSTHMKPEMLPPDTFTKGRKIVLLFRNPKDTLVSLFHHMKREKVIGDGFKISWNCFVDAWMQGNLPPFDYFYYYNLWQTLIEQRKEAEILLVNFEDLKKDGVGELKRISAYLGYNHDETRIKQVLAKCSLNNLKADVEKKLVDSPLVDDKGNSILYRKGIIGDWKNHFTVAQNEQMDSLIAKKMKNSMFKWQNMS